MFRTFAKIAAGLALLVVIVLAYLLHGLDARVHAILVDQLQVAEAKIGRQIKVGPLHLDLGLTSAIVVEDVVIAAPAGQHGELAEPLLRVPEARLVLPLGPLVRSRGASLAIDELILRGPEITLVRTPEGLSIDDIVARIAAAPPGRPPEVQVSIKTLAVEAAKLRLLSAGGGVDGGVRLDPITASATDFQIDAPSRVALTAAAPSATASIQGAVELAPPAGAPARARVVPKKIELHVTGLAAQPFLTWARVDPGKALDLTGAEVLVDASIEPGASVAFHGKIALAGVRLGREIEGQAIEQGDPLTASIDADATLDLAQASLAVPRFEIGLGPAVAKGSASVKGLGAAPVLESLELKVSADAAALLRMLPAGYRPRPVAIDGPILLAIQGGGARDQAHASIAAEVHSLAPLDPDAPASTPSPGGVPMGFSADLAFARAAGTLKIDKLMAHAGDLSAEGEIALAGLGVAPAIEALALRIAGPSEVVLALVPPSKRPPGVSLKGPLTGSAKLRGDAAGLEGKLAIDLGKVGLRAPGLDKPGGMPLAVEVEGKAARAGSAHLDRASVRLAGLSAGVRGDIKGRDQIDLAFDARGEGLASLLRVAPQVAERLGSATLDGKLAASGTVRRSPGKTRLDAKATLSDARIKRGVVLLTGAPSTTIAVEAQKGSVSIQADADLGATAISLAGVFTKPAGKASSVAFALSREGDKVAVQKAKVNIPGLAVEGLDLATEPHHLHIAAPATTLSMTALTQAMPLLEGRVPAPLADATLRFGAALDADPQKLDEATLHLSAIDITGSLGHLEGSLDIEGLPSPKAVRFQITGGELALGAGHEKGEPLELPGEDGGVPVTGHVHLDRIAARGQTIRALDADLGLEKGRIKVDRLRAELWGGAIELDRSWVDLAESPAADLHLKMSDLDLAQLPPGKIKDPHGRLSGSADLRGRGVDLDALARALTGTIRIDLKDFQGRPALRRKVTLQNPLLSRAFERAREKHDPNKTPLELRQVKGTFELGPSKVTFKEPLLLAAQDFDARLQGSVSLAGIPALDGQIDIHPEAIHQATKGFLLPLRPVPLRLKVDGEGDEIKLELIEIGESLLSLRGAKIGAD
ncbi:MAG: AsmA-like C-terminal region-containing protein [Byssovorax sp.]